MNRLVKIIAILTLLSVVLVSLTACMKVSMQEENVFRRAKEAGLYQRFVPPREQVWIDDYYDREYKVKNVYEFSIYEDEVMKILFIHTCVDLTTAKMVEEKCSTFETDDKKFEDFRVYRYDKIVMYGPYELIVIARGY